MVAKLAPPYGLSTGLSLSLSFLSWEIWPGQSRSPVGELFLFRSSAAYLGLCATRGRRFRRVPRSQPGRALGIQHLSREVVGLKFWRRLGHLPSASLKLGASTGSGVGEGLTLRPRVLRGVKARAEGARAGRRHSPPGLQAQRRAARAARAAGAQQAWALAARRQTARQSGR